MFGGFLLSESGHYACVSMNSRMVEVPSQGILCWELVV